jgi:Domain of unknown function (DUF4367)
MDDRMLHEYRRDPDPRFARQLRERLRRTERPRGLPRPLAQALATACALSIVIALFTMPSVRVSAQAILDLFRVQRFAAVEFDESRLEVLQSLEKDRGLLVFDQKETLREPGPARYVSSHEAASPEAGFAVSAPTYLPDGLKADSVFVEGEGSMRLSVSEAKLRALLDRLDVNGVNVPPNLDGGWIEVRKPPVVVQRFSSPKREAVLVQARSPEVSVPAGWDVAQLGEIGLRVLGLDAGEAKRIARATDWRSTLLVPVPLNATTFRQVTVRGNSGLLIVTTGESPVEGKPRRMGTMLLWSDGDRVFCIRGNLSAADVIQMAESIPS